MSTTHVSAKLAAEMLDCTPRYVREFYCANGLLRYRMKGKIYLIEVASIQELIRRETKGCDP